MIGWKFLLIEFSLFHLLQIITLSLTFFFFMTTLGKEVTLLDLIRETTWHNATDDTCFLPSIMLPFFQHSALWTKHFSNCVLERWAMWSWHPLKKKRCISSFFPWLPSNSSFSFQHTPNTIYASVAPSVVGGKRANVI